jgi:hypothetical protein
VLAIALSNDILNTVEIAEAITFSKFVDSLDQPITAGKIPSHSRSYLRLGSKKVLADHNIDCILPVDLPETLQLKVVLFKQVSTFFIYSETPANDDLAD